MLGGLGRVSVLVDHHGEAIAFYVDRLGFEMPYAGELDDEVRQTPEDVSVHFEDCYVNQFVLVESKE